MVAALLLGMGHAKDIKHWSYYGPSPGGSMAGGALLVGGLVSGTDENGGGVHAPLGASALAWPEVPHGQLAAVKPAPGESCSGLPVMNSDLADQGVPDGKTPPINHTLPYLQMPFHLMPFGFT